MGASDAWIRARPGTPEDPDQPHLKLPGSNRLRTNPDGLWFCFGGTAADPYVDIFGVFGHPGIIGFSARETGFFWWRLLHNTGYTRDVRAAAAPLRWIRGKPNSTLARVFFADQRNYRP